MNSLGRRAKEGLCASSKPPSSIKLVCDREGQCSASVYGLPNNALWTIGKGQKANEKSLALTIGRKILPVESAQHHPCHSRYIQYGYILLALEAANW